MAFRKYAAVVPHCSAPEPGLTARPWPMPETEYVTTAGFPEASSYTLRVVPPGRPSVADGVWPMPQTSVHWSRRAVALAGYTV